ncbi:MAG: hypothetical protein JST38_14815 [Bacteroidetes bacterium]|nr:hypothetical protein [Bacteroidota bacterium]
MAVFRDTGPLVASVITRSTDVLSCIKTTTWSWAGLCGNRIPPPSSCCKMIAVGLFISLATVQTYVRNIYTKLHVNCGREAVVVAWCDKIV